MAQTLYASFPDAAQAEKAAGALLDYGVQKEDLSLIANDEYGRTVSETAGTFGATATAASYKATADQRATNADERVARVGDTGTMFGRMADPDNLAGNAGANYSTSVDPTVPQSAYAATDAARRADYSTATREGNCDTGGNQTAETRNDTEKAAKSGLSTTTPEDAGAGAVKGAGIGLGVGILAGLASLLVPGVGLVIGGGALATAIGGAALTTGAGAIAGGVTGYLKDQGVPEDTVRQYQNTINEGGGLLTLHVPSGDVDQATAEQIIAKYGGKASAY